MSTSEAIILACNLEGTLTHKNYTLLNKDSNVNGIRGSSEFGADKSKMEELIFIGLVLVLLEVIAGKDSGLNGP